MHVIDTVTTEAVAHLFAAALGDDGNSLVSASSPYNDRLDFATSVAAAMSARPRRLECRFLYDARGSALYEQITRLPEYYPTRTEAAILERCSRDIAALAGPVTLVELGAGYSVKTDHLLQAFHRAHGPEVTYVPIDVSRSALEHGIRAIGRRRPTVRVVGINGTYEEALPVLGTAAPKLVIFLGSTLGNLDDGEADRFWSGVANALTSGDYVLLGVDLVKDVATLEAAYNDSAGVTAAFTVNLFARMNRELGAGLDLEAFRHEARWNPRAEQIEIDACVTAPQVLHVAPISRRFEIEAGERLRVEISRKFRLEPLCRQLSDCGLRTLRVFTDSRKWFGLVLLQRVDVS